LNAATLNSEATNELELRLRSRLGEEVVDARLGGDGRCRQRIVARDHDGFDAHAAELSEPLLDAAFDDVLELDDAEHGRAVGHDERRRALLRDVVHDGADSGRERASQPSDVGLDGVGGALANLGARSCSRRSCASGQ
jgi:hypothetical protein